MIKKRLGVGTFGRVYMAIDIENQECFAIKIQKKIPDKRKFLLLQKEAEIIRDLSAEPGFPKLKIFFKENKRGFLVMSYLGQSLSNLFHYNQGRFSLKSVCMIALQLISRIETLHSKFYIHRDIKLENITIGPNNDYKLLYLIDFGLSKSYLDEDGNHIKMRNDKGMVGTVRYSSVYTQQGLEQSRRDDLISIGYVLIYLLKEELPWQKVKIDYNNTKDKEEKYKKILNLKLETTNESLCENLPKQFLSYMNYVKNLEFDQTPDYKTLKGLFQETLSKFNYENDLEFDWRKLFRFNIPSDDSAFVVDSRINSKENINLIHSLDHIYIEKVNTNPNKSTSKNQDKDNSRNTFCYAHWSKCNSLFDSQQFKNNSILRSNSNTALVMSPPMNGAKSFLFFKQQSSKITCKGGIDLNARKIFSEMDGLLRYKKEFHPSNGKYIELYHIY